MRVLVTGCQGQVGGQLVRRMPPGVSVLAIDKPECDLTNPDQIRKTVRGFRPDVIINPAAFTAVDLAESERELAFAINETAPRVLAEEARALDAVMIHYSTDYVFDGSKTGPWLETDKPNPLNVYGESKLAGEQAVAETGGRYLIFRTSWVYGPEGNNFLLKMLKLGAERSSLHVVGDQVGAPTSSLQLAEATLRVLEQVVYQRAQDFPCGLYHLTAAGTTSWCGFACAIFGMVFSLTGQKCADVVEITSDDYRTPAKRPMNSVLNNSKFEETFGFRLERWEEALAIGIGELENRQAVSDELGFHN